MKDVCQARWLISSTRMNQVTAAAAHSTSHFQPEHQLNPQACRHAETPISTQGADADILSQQLRLHSQQLTRVQSSLVHTCHPQIASSYQISCRSATMMKIELRSTKNPRTLGTESRSCLSRGRTPPPCKALHLRLANLPYESTSSLCLTRQGPSFLEAWVSPGALCLREPSVPEGSRRAS